MTLAPGQKLGPYKIIEAAGAGGMGEVYKAEDTRLDRTVAVKVLPNRTAGNADLRSRFEREARAISSLNHPHICTLHDVGQHEGIDYLVMEYIEGESLSDRLAKGPLDLDEALRIAGQIAGALDTAHRQGLIHRDLKPANVMLTREGAKLLDFGLAKLALADGVVDGVSGITQTTPLTGAGTIIGTMQYMAPEQLEGGEADARCDIFAFGAVLYEMVTGQRAFEGKSHASLIASIMGTTPAPVSQVKPMTPPGLDRLINKCLAKDPDDRWQSARDLADELRWISQSGSQAGIPAPLSARRRFRFRLAWGIAAAAVLCAGVLGWLYAQQVMAPITVVRSEITPPEGAEFEGEAGGSVALSPDGSKIVFTASDSSGQRPRLWVRPINAIEALPLPGTEGASFPFWSPDSKQIAFYADSKLKRILATGGPALTICEARSGRGGSWNDDDVIIFTPTFDGVINRVAAAGGEPEAITVRDTVNNDFTHRWACFLPDNDHFLYFARTGSGAGSEKDAICLSSLSEPEVSVRLINTKSDIAYADGHILFMRDEILMAQPFDPGSLELTDDAVPVAEQVSFVRGWSRGIFSADRKGKLAYRKGLIEQGSRLLVYQPDGTVVDSIGQTDVYGAFNLARGRDRLAVTIEDQSSSNDDIWIIDLSRGLKTRFTFDNASDLAPVWSRDDTRIVWRSDREDGRGLYMKRTDIADTAHLLVRIDDLFWPWEIPPDNSDLLYSQLQKDGKGAIMIAPLDGSAEPRTLIVNGFDNWGARVSDDGRWLAYCSNESGTPQVYISPFPNPTSKWQVSVDGGLMPYWNSRSDRLYYRDLKDHVLEAEIDGSGVVCRVGSIDLLFAAELEAPQIGLLNESGRMVLNTTIETDMESRMLLVQNWPEELKN